MKKATEINTDITDIVQLVSVESVEEQFGSAMASAVATDQVVTWAKFILTDDKPNANRQRIPAEEFDNLINTGVYKPIKMALGDINDGHDDAKPIGVITNLVREGNKIIALAALWDHEREADVAQVKGMMKSGKSVNVSWEILYGRSKLIDGISDLLDTALKAVTIVGMPAYAGRTQLLAVAARKWSPAYIEKLPDTSFLYVDSNGERYFPFRDDTGKIDQTRLPMIIDEISQAHLPQNTLKNIKHQVTRLSAMITADASIQDILVGEDNFITEEQKLETKELETKVSELEVKLALANDTLAKKELELVSVRDASDVEVKALTVELEPLREFKQSADNAAERVEKLSAIKAKFDKLNLEKAAEYFDDNADKLLGMDENGIDFMLQEMIAFKEDVTNVGNASEDRLKLPNISGSGGKMSITDLAVALRERSKK